MPSNDAGCRWWWWRFGGETLSSQPWQRAAQPRQTFFPQLLLAAASECTNPNLSPGSPSEQYKVLHFLLLLLLLLLPPTILLVCPPEGGRPRTAGRGDAAWSYPIRSEGTVFLLTFPRRAEATSGSGAFRTVFETARTRITLEKRENFASILLTTLKFCSGWNAISPCATDDKLSDSGVNQSWVGWKVKQRNTHKKRETLDAFDRCGGRGSEKERCFSTNAMFLICFVCTVVKVRFGKISNNIMHKK